MPRVEVLALDIRLYRAGGSNAGALVPRVASQTAHAQAAKEPPAPSAAARYLDRPVLRFTPAERDAFLGGVRKKSSIECKNPVSIPAIGVPWLPAGGKDAGTHGGLRREPGRRLLAHVTPKPCQDKELNDSVGPWRVLILSAGLGNETLRDEVHKIVSDLGFDVSAFDRGDYPIYSLSHSHASCIEALDQHDILLALIDEKEGGQFQVDKIPQRLRAELVQLGVIAEQYKVGTPTPSILQVEVLTARAKQKPVICLVPESTKNQCVAVLKELPSLIDRMVPRHKDAPDLQTLMTSRSWSTLHEHYEVPTRGIPFGQLAFIERIRHEEPNYISYFQLGRYDDLTSHIKSRIRNLPLEISKHNYARAESLVQRKRTPVAGSQSLAWLKDHGLIISGPYKSDVATEVELPLLRNGRSVALPHHLESRKSVALLGDPGMGKSTYLLLAIADLYTSAQGAPNILFASWSEIAPEAQRGSAENLIRTLIGLCADRTPWPEQVSLPAAQWLIVIDGIDESEVDLPSLRPMLDNLRKFGTLLISCREYDFERRLYPIQNSFELILRLLPWRNAEIDEYRAMLIGQGDDVSVDYIDSHRDDYRGVFSVPLWLTMITFLSRHGKLLSADGDLTDYALLSRCATAMAHDELRRNGRVPENDSPALLRGWQVAAWEIYMMRRESRQLGDQSLRSLLKVSGDGMWNACRSLLEEKNGAFIGFAHETFFEYWLAENIVLAMLSSTRATVDLVQALSYQRSVSTNRLVRQGIAISGEAAAAAAGLREAFWHADYEQVFARNQILYFLGRIDGAPATLRFLLAIWHNKEEDEFIRYSAAHAAVTMGAAAVEDEFYHELAKNGMFDRMNRWYHLYYYGDIPAAKDNDVGEDDGTVSPGRAIRQLVKRLQRAETRHLNLRRIELHTLRRFIETQGTSVVPPDLADVLCAVENELASVDGRPDYVEGVRMEVELIRRSVAIG